MSASTGETLRNQGCALAANRRPIKTAAIQLLILERAAQGTEFTVDDALTPSDAKKRANNTGAAFLALSVRKLIRFTGRCERSARAYRHAGLNRVWIADDPSKCRIEAEAIRAEMASVVSTLSTSRQGELFGHPDDLAKALEKTVGERRGRPKVEKQAGKPQEKNQGQLALIKTPNEGEKTDEPVSKQSAPNVDMLTLLTCCHVVTGDRQGGTE